MTHEEILNMQAGKKLDALIEQYVFGNEVRWIGDSYPISGEGEGKYPYMVEDYSTDISAAWEVEEEISKLDKTGHYVKALCDVVGTPKDGSRLFTQEDWRLIHASPSDRCKAALLAVLDSINLPREEETC